VPGIIKPVGPKDPKVYWVRRLVLLGALISTLILVFSIINQPSDVQVSENNQVAEPIEAVVASPDPTETILTTPTPTPDPTILESCLDDQIAVAVSVSSQTPKVLQGLTITMSITNVSTQICQRDVGSGANEITIVSGPALIWSTDFCNPSAAEDIRTLQPNQKVSVVASWDGMQTLKDCVKLDKATAGAYWAYSRNDTKNSEGARFVITN